jgi:hypothetical protein
MLPLVSIGMICFSSILGGFLLPTLAFSLLLIPYYRYSSTLAVLITSTLVHQIVLVALSPPQPVDDPIKYKLKAVLTRGALIGAVIIVQSLYHSNTQQPSSPFVF